MSLPRYPDSLRHKAIALFRLGKGYKAIASELGLSRDTVRGWVQSYRITGRTESVQATGRLQKVKPQGSTQQSWVEKETLYAVPRTEYETTSESLSAIADRHGVKYNNFRNHLRQYHPESYLLHTYAKQEASFRAELARQREQLDVLERTTLAQLKYSLEDALAKI